jgi:uncharacterized protein
MMPFWLAILLVTVVAIVAGAIASVAGFGIGSLLTPLLGLQIGIKTAVAAISIPHLIGTALRFAMLREHVDRRVLWSFGLMSAAGGLSGALLHTLAGGPILTALLGTLLVFAGVMGLAGWTERLRLSGWMAWIAGGVSGLLGGLVGNQGGIRSAAMLGFNVQKNAFVATATAVGLMVDAARMPIYFLTQFREVVAAWPFVVAATVGVVVGTVAGRRLLQQIPEPLFRKVVSALILALGIATLAGSRLAAPS